MFIFLYIKFSISDFQRQKGSGAYFLGTKIGFINIYNDVQNVLVLLEGSEGEHSILVNCHYDSVPGSAGNYLLLKNLSNTFIFMKFYFQELLMMSSVVQLCWN